MKRMYRCSTCNRIYDNEDDCLEHEALAHPKKMDLDMAIKVLEAVRVDDENYAECRNCPKEERDCDEGCVDKAIAIVLDEMKKLRGDNSKEKGKC